MKKVFLYFILLSHFLFTACNFTEEVHINEDGSGKININFNGSQLMLTAAGKIGAGEMKRVDSIVSLKKLFEEEKDSILKLTPEEQAKLKRIENFTMHMIMDSEAKKMEFSMYSPFNKVNELRDVFRSLQEVNSSTLQKQSGGVSSKFATLGNPKGTEVSYSFKGNTFSRNTKITDKELFKKETDSLEQAKIFFEGSTYTLNYHFPKRIKKISSKEALFSLDGKSFILEVDFLSIMKDPTLLNVEVELED